MCYRVSALVAPEVLTARCKAHSTENAHSLGWIGPVGFRSTARHDLDSADDWAGLQC
jgi:hypothetical protein